MLKRIFLTNMFGSISSFNTNNVLMLQMIIKVNVYFISWLLLRIHICMYTDLQPVGPSDVQEQWRWVPARAARHMGCVTEVLKQHVTG